MLREVRRNAWFRPEERQKYDSTILYQVYMSCIGATRPPQCKQGFSLFDSAFFSRYAPLGHTARHGRSAARTTAAVLYVIIVVAAFWPGSHIVFLQNTSEEAGDNNGCVFVGLPRFPLVSQE